MGLKTLRDTGSIWPSIAEAPYRAGLSPEDEHMHTSYSTGNALQYLRKYTEELHFRFCFSVKLKPWFVWLALLIKASGKPVIMLLYSSGNGVHMKAWSLCWPALDTGPFVPREGAAFLVSSKGNPVDVWTRGGTCSLDTPLLPEMKP